MKITLWVCIFSCRHFRNERFLIFFPHHNFARHTPVFMCLYPSIPQLLFTPSSFHHPMVMPWGDSMWAYTAPKEWAMSWGRGEERKGGWGEMKERAGGTVRRKVKDEWNHSGRGREHGIREQRVGDEEMWYFLQSSNFFTPSFSSYTFMCYRSLYQFTSCRPVFLLYRSSLKHFWHFMCCIGRILKYSSSRRLCFFT